MKSTILLQMPVDTNEMIWALALAECCCENRPFILFDTVECELMRARHAIRQTAVTFRQIAVTWAALFNRPIQ